MIKLKTLVWDTVNFTGLNALVAHVRICGGWRSTSSSVYPTLKLAEVFVTLHQEKSSKIASKS